MLFDETKKLLYYCKFFFAIRQVKILSLPLPSKF